MPIVAVNAGTDAAPRADLADLRPGAAVTVMIHGYRYDPARPAICPHRGLFALSPDRQPARVISWPRRLGLARGGVGIGFGWSASGSIWGAYRRAGEAGLALATLVHDLRAAGAGPVHVVAHSLGARVALSALPHLAPGDLGRLVLLAAAEFRRPAAAALATRAGRATEVLNVTSRENDLFDGLLEVLFAAGLRDLGPSLGAGLDRPNLATLQIDGEAHRAALARLGYPLPAPQRRICHWSAYLRPGAFPLYRAVLDGRLPFALLQEALAPAPAPRWSRLMLPLPAGRKPAQ